MAGLGDLLHRQGVAVRIAVVAEHGNRLAGAVLVHRRRVVVGHRRPILPTATLAHVNRHRSRVAQAPAAIVGHVGEGVDAEEPRVWPVGDRSPVVDQGAAARLGDPLHCQGVAVRIAVVAEHGDGLAGTVLVHSRGVVTGDRRAVLPPALGDGHRDGRRVAEAASAILRHIGEGIGAGKAGIGPIGDRAAVVDYGAMARLGDPVHRQGVAVGIAVVGQYADGLPGAVLRHRRRIVTGDRVAVERLAILELAGGAGLLGPVVIHGPFMVHGIVQGPLHPHGLGLPGGGHGGRLLDAGRLDVDTAVLLATGLSVVGIFGIQLATARGDQLVGIATLLDQVVAHCLRPALREPLVVRDSTDAAGVAHHFDRTHHLAPLDLAAHLVEAVAAGWTQGRAIEIEEGV